MWVFSKLGFFSIVESRGADEFQIRARVKADLERLLAKTEDKTKIIETPMSDYGFRIIVPRSQMVRSVMAMTNAIDYDNFKEAIHDDPDQRSRVGRYGRVWRIMTGIQDIGQDTDDGDPADYGEAFV